MPVLMHILAHLGDYPLREPAGSRAWVTGSPESPFGPAARPLNDVKAGIDSVLAL